MILALEGLRTFVKCWFKPCRYSCTLNVFGKVDIATVMPFVNV